MSNLRVVVTGAGSGIGWAIAQAFAADGASLVVGDASDEQLAGARSEQLGAVVCDVASPTDVDALFARATEHLGGLDVLVNNAGIAGPTGPIEDIEPADWDRTLAVNLTGAYLCTRAAVPLLRRSSNASIINICSSAGVLGYPLRSPYAASKWGLVGLTKTLAMELGPAGIRVNAINPGPVEGDRMQRVIAAESAATGRTPDEVRASYVAQTSMRAFMEPEEIAAAVTWLCSPAASKITGQILSVDGNTETLRG